MATDESTGEPAASYWYPSDDDDTRDALRVLRALRRFRATDVGMRRRAQADMDMNETDLLAIRHLIKAEADGAPASPKDLSRVLGISTAATAKLLARLALSGHVRREPNPHDGRAQVLYATSDAHTEVRQTLGETHRRMLEVAEGLTLSERRAVVSFLDDMSEALEPSRPGHDDGTYGRGRSLDR